jgi:hypothetical protein
VTSHTAALELQWGDGYDAYLAGDQNTSPSRTDGSLRSYKYTQFWWNSMVLKSSDMIVLLAWHDSKAQTSHECLVCNTKIDRKVPISFRMSVCQCECNNMRTDRYLLWWRVVSILWLTSPSGPRLFSCVGFEITLRHTALGRTPLGEWLTRRMDLYLTKTKLTRHRETDIHDSGGIRTRNPITRAAADTGLGRRGHWDRQWKVTTGHFSKMRHCLPTLVNVAQKRTLQ